MFKKLSKTHNLSTLLLVLLLTIAVTLIDAQRRRPRPQFRVAFEWNLMDYRWPSADDKIRAIRNSQYIPENNVITGIAFYNNRLFLTLPRWRHGVPATLTWIPAPNTTTQTAPLLNPFPTWEMNRLGDCRALQNVQSVEVDLNGVLWVLDGGKTATMETNPEATCPPRLILIDLNSDDNRIVREYIFPNEIALHDGSFLNDLVIDDYNGRYAYITDNSAIDPGLIVYSYANNTCWKVREARSMHAATEAIEFTINDVAVNAAINVDGIALAPAAWGPSRDLIFTPLSSFHLYSISTAILRNKELATGQTVANYIKDLGMKPSTTDGMIMDENGILYYGLLGMNAIGYWNTTLPISAQRLLAKDSMYLQWPDSFAIDPVGNLYVISNRLQNFLSKNIRAIEGNYRILVAHIGARSYLYGTTTTTPGNSMYSTSSGRPEGRHLMPDYISENTLYPKSFYDTNTNPREYSPYSSESSVQIYPNGQDYNSVLATSTVGSLMGSHATQIINFSFIQTLGIVILTIIVSKQLIK